MTGFGSARFEDDEKSIQVEVKTVNNRFLNIKIKNPEFLNGYEQEIEKCVKQKISRGSVNLAINCQTTNKESVCSINLDNLKAYYKMFQQAKKEIDCGNDIRIDSLINLPGVIEKVKDRDIDHEQLIEPIYNLVSAALDDMIQMRLRAGEDIMAEISSRGKHVRLLLNEVEGRIPKMVANYAERLHERITNLIKNTDVTITREELCKEVALFSDRSDITEEIKLLNSHIEQITETMNKGGYAGKKLEFIVQEMFREANTMGSKSNDETMLNCIFDIKAEIEKIKELVLNVE